MQDYFNSENGSVEQNAKVVIFAFIIMAIFALYVLKLFSLQVIEGAQYRKQSQKISSQVKTIDAQRGEIFDRNASMPMVINTDSFAIDLMTVTFWAVSDGNKSPLAVLVTVTLNVYVG